MLVAAVYTSDTGIRAASDLIDVVSNNVANANTTGFKAASARFQDLVYTGLVPTPPAPVGVQLGTGAVLDDTAGIFTQGATTPTGGPLDLAVQGNGFFTVTLGDGTTGYTRAGNFTVDASRQVVTGDGFRLSPPVTVPADTVSVTARADGTVVATTAAGDVAVGQLVLTTFPNPGGLARSGQTAFVATAASGPGTASPPGTNGAGTLVVGSLEQSNVNTATELTTLIVAQRAFSSNTQALQVANNTIQSTLDIVV